MDARLWTHNEETSLVANAEAGDCSHDIADRLGRTWQAVKSKAQRMGVRLGRGHYWKINAEGRAALLDFLQEEPGASLVRAAARLRKATFSVWTMAKNLVRDGLLKKVGGYGKGCRFVLTKKWFSGWGKSDLAHYREYQKAVLSSLPWLQAA